MAEYINRAELIENLNKFAPEHYNALINQLITKQPTADVMEVKHGKWIVPSGAIKIFEDRYVICSECNVMIPVVKELDRYWYCPNCGAKMDGKDTNVPTK